MNDYSQTFSNMIKSMGLSDCHLKLSDNIYKLIKAFDADVWLHRCNQWCLID